MNLILLEPTDVLFFRDGRPMSGSLAGHGAAWPLPDVTNHALHAALHRAGFRQEAHPHRRGRSGVYEEQRDRVFGSLSTAGPFPVEVNGGGGEGRWFFPRPLDVEDGGLKPTLVPVRQLDWPGTSSLPKPLRYAAGSLLAPSKENRAKGWISGAAFRAYLAGEDFALEGHAADDGDFSDSEQTIGIGIDPETQTTGSGVAKGQFYSAHYLRLRENWRLGIGAKADDKEAGDLIDKLFNGADQRIVIGGQQRTCTARRFPRENRSLPLPMGIENPDGFHRCGDKYLVKWVLLSPAIWPRIAETRADGTPITARDGSAIAGHPGGWIPNWVDEETGEVELLDGPGKSKAFRKNIAPGKPIRARLVGAIVPKPIAVTGWALPNGGTGEEGGAKSTHLAVPAGAVYYFEADSEGDAKALAEALNWHGSSQGTAIKNRRSTLLGEKGYGLGVCGTWRFHDEVRGYPKA